MNSQSNETAQKENGKYLEMEICDSNDREFKFAILKKKLNEIQENTGRQFNEVRNKIN